MSTSHVQPRRRSAHGSLHGLNVPSSLRSIDPKDKPNRLSHKDPTLKKSTTFQASKSPSQDVDDPILDIHRLPSRSPTCPQALEDLVAAHEEKVVGIIKAIEYNVNTILEDKDALPVPQFLLDHASESMEADKENHDVVDQKFKISKLGLQARDHHHTSDSGIGTSLSDTASDRSSTSVYTRHHRSKSTSTSTSARTVFKDGHVLSDYATRKIKTIIVDPILEQKELKEYHSLVAEIPKRIGDRVITCLRDLEKTLIFLAPTKTKSPRRYLEFCKASIQRIQTTVAHLHELDQRRPTDRPYTNNYFIDLLQQVRQYASIMEQSRRKKAAGKPLNEMDYTSDEKLELVGGPSQNGKPAELVRKKDGKTIAIEADHIESKVDGSDDEDTLIDDDVRRSMARKRKCDQGKEEYRECRECGKVFTRPCDLTKHEKTHSRPWKCPQPDCKYHTLGWPTEKERDRHVNDKHSDAPALYRCLFPPCPYTSKRESNCKQHMEKTHGWEYVRSKSKKGQTLIPTRATPPSSTLPTPTSDTAFPRLSTPSTPFGQSPAMSSNYALSPQVSVDTTNSTYLQSTGTDFAEEVDSMGGINHGAFNFDGFDDGLQPHGDLFSPPASEGRRDSGSPFAMGNNRPVNFGSTFEDTFNFQELHANNPFPPMGSFFPQYNIQQPTPAWSDYNLDFDGNLKIDSGTSPIGNAPGFSPGARDDLMLSEVDPSMFPDNNNDGFGTTNGDFTLFGDNGAINGEAGVTGNSAAPSMFPDLVGNVGGQFPHDQFMYDSVDDHMDMYTNDAMY